MCMLLVGARYLIPDSYSPGTLDLIYSHTAYDWERPHLSLIPSVHILYDV
jgi:hypothetical protein